MPVCTHCAFPADHVYTTYASKSNVRLDVCPRCEAFLDPLIEHPPLLILLDLVLLQPRVYLHLLFNRGAAPLDAEPRAPPGHAHTAPDHAPTGPDARRRTHAQLARLALVAVAAESAVRLLPAFVDSQPAPTLTAGHVARVLAVVCAETAAQLATTTALALAALWWLGWWPFRRPQAFRDGRQENFTPALVPLTLLYSTLLPLLLQLVLSIWYRPSTTHESLPALDPPASLLDATAASLCSAAQLFPALALPARLRAAAAPLAPLLADAAAAVRALEAGAALALAQWSASDRAWAWAGTRLLGGMASGYGLRVVLPTPPAVTTALVFAGWIAAAGVGRAAEHILAVQA